jgi:thioredoxin 1
LLLAVLGVGGWLLYCRTAGDGSCPFALGNNSSAHNESLEGETMSTHVENYRGVQYADQSSFEQQVLRADATVLVDFYADWCGPCQALTPVLEEFAGENPDVEVVKVNVDDSPQLAARYGISSIPSLRVFRQGRITGQHVGLADKRRLQALVGR